MSSSRRILVAPSVLLAGLIVVLPALASARAKPTPAPALRVLPKALLSPGTLPQHSADDWRGAGVALRVRVSPSPARLGQALTYRGLVFMNAPSVQVRFEPPRSGGALTWSRAHAGRGKRGPLTNVYSAYDSVWFEARLQIFETGTVTIPGPVVRMSSMPGRTRPGTTRLPNVSLLILPTVTASDSNAELRKLHGPLAAPWWELVPWPAIGLASLLVLGGVFAVRALRRRKPKPVHRAAPPVPVARPRLDPAAEALRALAALRLRELPAAGRFGEHAVELTAILRRFLEATVGSPQPGDSSGELLEHLRNSRVPADDFERLSGLLSLWDRVKFARAPLTVAEAVRCEEAVESYIRRVAQARLDAAAAAARAAAARMATTGQPRPGGPGGARPRPPTAPSAPSAPEAA